MKDKLIYVIILLVAFFMVTGAMYYGASNYKNIFAFDFTPANADTFVSKSPNPQVAEKKPNEVKPILTKIDSTAVPQNRNRVTQDSADVKISASAFVDSAKVVFEQLKKLKEQISLKNETALAQNQVSSPQVQNPRKDSLYTKWIKNSVKLYEAMDSKKAAKIIQGYNDNIARDIIFSMKKKKAAEIIAEFKPELANRIISVQ
ncbi:MAG: hypothetical protein GYA14_02325 [Ignavibacteria bacterium]|nr:hypothetical protein [Ignavibacteria bacterium]